MKWSFTGGTVRGKTRQHCHTREISSGHYEAREDERDQGTPDLEIWSQECGQQDSRTAGEDGGG